MLRVHFDTADLTRIRVLDTPDPLWETLLSLHLLQDRDADLRYRSWRSGVRGRLNGSVRLLAALAPPRGYSADFLTPAVGVGDLDTAVDLLLRTPRSVLRGDLNTLSATRPVPSWVSALATGGIEVLRQLEYAVRTYFSVALEPYWSGMRDQVSRDRLRRARVLLNEGVEGLLANLHGTARWRSPVLEIDYPVDQELRLEGRGLVLAPSVFCQRAPVTLLDPHRQPVLVCPIEESGWLVSQSDTSSRSLSALLGRTRAAVFETVGSRPELSTTALAAELGISPAGVSQHITVLRDSGLVATDRAGGTARHAVTMRGASLLEGLSPTGAGG